jgi:hypothetical protein
MYATDRWCRGEAGRVAPHSSSSRCRLVADWLWPPFACAVAAAEWK